MPVTERKLSVWESGKRTPPVTYWPAIMEFLGNCPYEEAHSLGDRLRLHRTHRGLTHRALAKLLNVDPGSLSRRETGERRPDRRSREVIERFLRAGDSMAGLTVRDHLDLSEIPPERELWYAPRRASISAVPHKKEARGEAG